jgi:diaminopimelate decarboxylase
MKVILRPRATGKTEELIRLAAEHGAYIVCRSLDEASRIKSISSDMCLDINLPITYSEFFERRYHRRGIKGFLIDDVDEFVQRLSQVPVLGVTLSMSDPDEIRSFEDYPCRLKEIFLKSKK